MSDYKTPGVYIQEVSNFPPSAAQVETALPVFIGYTERTEYKGRDLTFVPTRVSSVLEFFQIFGTYPKNQKYNVFLDEKKEKVVAARVSTRYYMDISLHMFYLNGGSDCYIISIGQFPDEGGIELDLLQQGLNVLAQEDEPTMVVIPDAMKLKQEDCYTLQQSMMAHCKEQQSRVALLDIWGADQVGMHPTTEEKEKYVKDFRNKSGINALDYAAAYYPWLEATVVSPKDWYNHIHLKTGQPDGAGTQEDVATKAYLEASPDVQTVASNIERFHKIKDDLEAELEIEMGKAEADRNQVEIDKKKAGISEAKRETYKYEDMLVNMSDRYANIVKAVARQLNLIPPSGVMAGIYSMVDKDRGVWKAPANVSVSSVVGPNIRLTDKDQERLNVDANSGKSINAIRTFKGKGTLVWGARTLLGNDNEWRYISVRRFFIMVEQSLQKSTSWAVFEPNDANTWVRVKGMIRNFLTGLWREGALAGATPGEAFFVNIGLGSSMTTDDILEGRMIVEIGMAVVRPAEFIVLKFSHKMQES